MRAPAAPEREYLFTSESVTEGHPDKLADQISDAVLDAHLAGDPHARVACETLLKTNLIVVAGEVRSRARVATRDVAIAAIRRAGYSDESLGFALDGAQFIDALAEQSADIAQGVDASAQHEQGAGDQGMMFGYASDETPELMPAPIMWAHHLARRLAAIRRAEPALGLWPDGKVQVTVRYRAGEPVGIDTLLISTQHAPTVAHGALVGELEALVVRPTLATFRLAGGQPLPPLRRLLVNPTGRFVVGGPQGDAGLTGRKIIVDTYGGVGRHGGGAFSGKDASKVDRSAAYFARYVAKQVVAAGLARRCEIQLAYAIGCAEPVSLSVHTFNTANVPPARIEQAIAAQFDARPAAIVQHLDLLAPRFLPTATYGHQAFSAG